MPVAAFPPVPVEGVDHHGMLRAATSKQGFSNRQTSGDAPAVQVRPFDSIDPVKKPGGLSGQELQPQSVQMACIRAHAKGHTKPNNSGSFQTAIAKVHSRFMSFESQDTDAKWPPGCLSTCQCLGCSLCLCTAQATASWFAGCHIRYRGLTTFLHGLHHA